MADRILFTPKVLMYFCADPNKDVVNIDILSITNFFYEINKDMVLEENNIRRDITDEFRSMD